MEVSSQLSRSALMAAVCYECTPHGQDDLCFGQRGPGIDKSSANVPVSGMGSAVVRCAVLGLAVVQDKAAKAVSACVSLQQLHLGRRRQAA